MAAPLLSNQWYRVDALRPKLRPHARLYRHRYRGQLWYLLQDPASGRVHRFSPSARFVIALMDGCRSVSELWDRANRQLGEKAPTQDELIQLLGQLHAADLLQSDVTPNVAELFSRGEREERGRFKRSYGNPMAIRLSLWDPDYFLDSIRGLTHVIWGRWGAVLWLLAVLPAVFLVPAHWSELSSDFTDRILSVNNLFALYLVFPILKALHELGHATATKAGGGEVHDMGIILLVLLPIPYVEASAATVFTSRYERAIVGAAGVAVETFVAAIALYLWLLVEPGFVRATLFNVMVIAGVSTLIFNGNPLLRYDAYYILADLIEIPNLASRSLHYWGYLFERYLLGVRDAEAPAGSVSERVWFLFYGLASSIYRIFVSFVIAVFIAGKFFFIGVLLAIWAVTAMIFVPLVRTFRHLTTNPRLRRHRFRSAAVIVGSLGALAILLFSVPMPNRTTAEGVIWLPEQALVRAGESGFMAEFMVKPGTEVAAGQPIIRLRDPALQAQLKFSEAKVAELEATLASKAAVDRAKAQIERDKLRHERETLAQMRQRVSRLVVHAGTVGIFTVPQSTDMLGQFYRKGELLGYIIGKAPPIARVVVPQDRIDQIRTATDAIQIRLVDYQGETFPGRIARAIPAGDEYLPSRALSVDGGGEIAIDPRESKSPKALQRVFQFDIAIDRDASFPYFGQRVYVRFDHQKQPMWKQWYRDIRLLFLSHFGV
ncbi:MAG TPA: peptidase M50 [Pseudolabrys sp.]|nr:peptidase M50 [Pseudolabrys sp.]